MDRNKTLVGTEIVLIVGLVSFVAAMAGLEHAAPGGARLGRTSALVFAAIPSALWLGYFYLQARTEPEPTSRVGEVFVLGAFVAAPLAGFVGGLLPPAAAGLDPLGARRVLANILITGLVQELAKYAVVRHTLHDRGELDAPFDAIVYTTAAGIGFATAHNHDHLISLGANVVLSQAAMTTVVTTLAHACFGGVLGYALGAASHSSARPVVRAVGVLGGLCAAAALNGVFTALEDRVTLAGASRGAAWRGIAGAAGFSAAVFCVVSLLIRRQLASAPPGGRVRGRARAVVPGPHPLGRHELIVALGVVALVAIGVIAQTGRSETDAETCDHTPANHRLRHTTDVTRWMSGTDIE